MTPSNVTIKADYVNNWLGDGERIEEINVESLAIIKDIIRYYSRIIAPEYKTKVIFTGEEDNTSLGEYGEEVLINYGLLLQGRVDEAVGHTIFRLLQISSGEIDVRFDGIFNMEAYKLISKVKFKGVPLNKFIGRNDALVIKLGKIIGGRFKAINEVRTCVQANSYIKKYLSVALEGIRNHVTNNIDIDKLNPLDRGIYDFKTYFYGIDRGNANHTRGFTNSSLKRSSISLFFKQFMTMFEKEISHIVKSHMFTFRDSISRLYESQYNPDAFVSSLDEVMKYSRKDYLALTRKGMSEYRGSGTIKRIKSLDYDDLGVYDDLDIELEYLNEETLFDNETPYSSLCDGSIEDSFVTLFENEADNISNDLSGEVQEFDRSKNYEVIMCKATHSIIRYSDNELTVSDVIYPVTIVDVI